MSGNTLKTDNPVIGFRVDGGIMARMKAISKREMIPIGTLARIWTIRKLEAVEAEIQSEDAVIIADNEARELENWLESEEERIYTPPE